MFVSVTFILKHLLHQTSAPGSQSSPWFTVHAPHILTLSGFPPLSHVQTPTLSEPSRTTSLPLPRSPIQDAAKRPNESPQSPGTKRQKVSEKGSPALSPRAQAGGAGVVAQRPPSAQAPAPSVPQPSQTHSQLLQPSHIPLHLVPAPAPSSAKPATHLPTNAPNPTESHAASHPADCRDQWHAWRKCSASMSHANELSEPIYSVLVI